MSELGNVRNYIFFRWQIAKDVDGDRQVKCPLLYSWNASQMCSRADVEIGFWYSWSGPA